MHEGCILWGTRVVVPQQGREMVLEELHEGHDDCHFSLIFHFQLLPRRLTQSAFVQKFFTIYVLCAKNVVYPEALH